VSNFILLRITQKLSKRTAFVQHQVAVHQRRRCQGGTQ